MGTLGNTIWHLGFETGKIWENDMTCYSNTK
jgi:hypothetical protein